MAAGLSRRRPLPSLFGAALLVVAAGAVAVSGAFDERPTPKRLGGNFPINEGATDLRDISAHNSPTLVRSPVDGDKLAVANRIDNPRFSCALHVSSDGGGSWAQTPIPVPRGEDPKCYAPDVVFAPDGTLYLSFVTLRGGGNVPHAAWIAASHDGGRTLSEPVKALGPLAFQVRLAADPALPRRLYLTWLQAAEVGYLKFAGPGNPIQFSRSDDGGRTWRRPARVSASWRPRAVAPSVTAGRGQELLVLYLDLGGDRLDYEGAHEGRGGPPYPGPWELVLARSSDGGRRWTETVVEDRLKPTHRILAFLPPFPSLAVDRRRGRAYAAFEDGRAGDADVRVWASHDGGASWGEPTRVNDTPERDGTSQYRPKLAVAPDGRLDVLYYDRRRDRRDRQTEVSLQSSLDHGKGFLPALRLSDEPFDSRIGFGSERGMPDLGSRLGLVSDDSRALAVWTDTRAGTDASGKQDLTRALVGFLEPVRPADGVISALRVVALALALAGIFVLSRSLWRSGSSRRARAGRQTW